MIKVEVYVPSVDREYDFEIDEYAPVRLVTEEIASMVCQKEQCTLLGDVGELFLCDRDRSRILPEDVSLNESGLVTGGRLILV